MREKELKRRQKAVKFRHQIMSQGIMSASQSTNQTPHSINKFANPSSVSATAASQPSMGLDEVHILEESSVFTTQGSIMMNEKQFLIAQLKNQQFNAIKQETAKLMKLRKKENARVLRENQSRMV